MHQCPFCQAEITEEIARFGGHCPSCLIEIPGDEAATDPGENTQAEPESSSQRGPLISGLVAAAVVLLAVGIWHSQQPEPVEEGPARSDYRAIPLSSHQDAALPQRPAPVEEVAEAEDRSERRNRTGGQVPGEAQPVAEGRVIPSKVSGPIANPLDAFAVGSGPKVRGPQGIVLTDDGQIEAMVGRVLERGNKRLQPCYDQKVRTQPGYQGQWRVSVDIATDGSVDGVSVSALRGADGSMERCIRSKVQRWSFQRIAHPVSSGTIYRFGN